MCIEFVVLVSCILSFIYSIGCEFCVSSCCVLFNFFLLVIGSVGGVKVGSCDIGVCVSCIFLVIFIIIGLGWLVLVILNVLVSVGVRLWILVMR